MLLIGKIGIGLVGTALLGGAIVSSEGFIHVRVEEKAPNGTHLSLVVPAMIMPVAAHFVPKADLRDSSGELRHYLPVIDAALSGLKDCADGTTLVEVIDEDSHVTVVKNGGAIIVDANDPDANVHVAVPLDATKRTIDEIAVASGPS